MNDNKYYPFERNRYYYGKLLTTNDLEAEQKYMNNKRKFINKVMFGVGKVCGLNVYKINEDTLMLESGFAIDGLGREIVVGQSEVKKLSAIDGFYDVKSEKMILTIEYNEFFTQPVYSLTDNQDGKEYEYNRIHEEFKLKLKDVETTNVDNLELKDSLIYNREIYSDENYKILIQMPKMASLKSDFKFITQIEKLSEINEKLNLKFCLNIAGFVDDENNEKLMINIKDLSLQRGETHIDEKWLRPNNVSSEHENAFMIKKNEVEISIGDKKYEIKDNIILPVVVSEREPIELIKTKVKNENLENVMGSKADSDIVLAIIDVMNIGDSCVIKNVEVPPEHKYSVQMPAQTPYIEKISSYYLKQNAPSKKQTLIQVNENNNENADLEFRKRINTVVSSGIFEMPLGVNVKANKTILSDEIMHNLGKGDVCVDVGFEFVVSASDKKDSYEKKIVFGNPEIFKDEGIDVADVTSAVEVLCEKGTFIVGLQFNKSVSLASIKVRWFAYRRLDMAQEVENNNGKVKGIYVKQDTVKLAPNDVHFFEIGFKNMNPTTLRYEVIDKNGGDINENGLYTAPGEEGVYEVKISCINEPSIFTFAYVIVMKKEAE